MRSKLTFLPLMLLIISAVDSNRNLPTIAIFGSPLIFYFLLAALIFLFPTAVVSAELASTNPKHNGIYDWLREAFGEKWGMAAIWLQWMNTIIWLPTILSFIAGALAFLFDPALIESKPYMIFSISFIFWGLTLVNLRGIHVSARLNNWFVLVGTLLPMCFLIYLGILWLYKGEPVQLSFSSSSVFKPLLQLDGWVALVAVMSSFTGMELATVHMTDVHHPKKLFPLTLGVASLIILGTMLLGSLTIAGVLPQDKINLAGGIMQVFDQFFQTFHLGFLIPLMTVLIVLGSIGGLINWIISPSKGLLFSAQHGFLPPYFTKLNRRGVASRVLITQAVLVTLLCALLLIVPTINSFYWFLTALNTGLYMLMYLLMFLAAIRLRKQRKPQNKGWSFSIPGGSFGLYTTCVFGVLGTFLTFFLGFVPPPNIDVGPPLRYTLMILAGNILFISPLFLTFLYKKRKSSL